MLRAHHETQAARHALRRTTHVRRHEIPHARCRHHAEDATPQQSHPARRPTNRCDPGTGAPHRRDRHRAAVPGTTRRHRRRRPWRQSLDPTRRAPTTRPANRSRAHRTARPRARSTHPGDRPSRPHHDARGSCRAHPQAASHRTGPCRGDHPTRPGPRRVRRTDHRPRNARRRRTHHARPVHALRVRPCRRCSSRALLASTLIVSSGRHRLARCGTRSTEAGTRRARNREATGEPRHRSGHRRRQAQKRPETEQATPRWGGLF
ncbi:proteophosphoglycan ppg4 [Cellulomonas gilvus ATCC 13127]|uniref:Proteophosphoglycan ppg4 n=1 Tax=Cellulomonas gilvus (strain ATCC 13127 / NRRL B-14078) TaxID=593907 RepID=F8A7P3_CELGA|nr:proteophosphoglycan ppg4 [Cellulomonas gilvus ATCC 13127]